MMGLANLDGSFTMTLYMHEEGPVSFANLKPARPWRPSSMSTTSPPCPSCLYLATSSTIR